MPSIPIENIQFPLALPVHSGEITSLVNSVYRGENAKKGWTTEADILGGIRISEKKVREIIGSQNNVIILAVLDDKVIGCVHLEKEGNSCWLGMLSVDVNFQTHGIGKIMIEKSEEYASNVFKCGEMKMKVIGIRTELVDYYVRRGYRLTGEREDFFTAEDTFGEPKTDVIYFEILSKRLL